MSEYICEEQRLRDQIPLTDEQLLGELDRIGARSYQFDLGPKNEILLRLSYEFLKLLVQIQESTPLEIAPVRGTAKGRRGRVLAS